ncbi:hypothetical protein D3C86_1724490 [compost metagenome]
MSTFQKSEQELLLQEPIWLDPKDQNQIYAHLLPESTVRQNPILEMRRYQSLPKDLVCGNPDLFLKFSLPHPKLQNGRPISV